MDLVQLRASVRASLVNVTETQYPNDSLDEAIRDGIRQMTLDHPYETTKIVTVTGDNFYNLTTLLGALWIPGLSQVRSIVAPRPDRVNEPIEKLHYKEYRVYEDSGVWYLRIPDGPPSGEEINISYTTKWLLAGLDGAATSNLTYLTEASLRFISLHYACLALATRSAGSLARQTPGDIVNWDNKTAQYTRAAREWLDRYLNSIGQEANKPAPVGLFRNMESVNSEGFLPITHRPVWYR